LRRPGCRFAHVGCRQSIKSSILEVMNTYSSPAVQKLFEEVARAYQRTPFEIAIFVLFVGGILVTMSVYMIVQSRTYRRRSRERAEENYKAALRRLQLTPSHETIVYSMSRYMKKPHLRYLLLEDENLFDSCAADLLAREDVTPDSIAALRVEIGFSRKNDKPPRSSTQIPTGSLVFLLRTPQDKGIPSRVLEPDPHAFRVQLSTKKKVVFPAGSPLFVVYHCAAGVFSFHTILLNQDKKLLRLRHSETLVRRQRRQYYRAATSLPVSVRSTDGSGRPVITRFTDLGGNGASLENPGKKYSPGDEVDLTFQPDRKESVSVTGTVLRLSRDDSVMHLEFKRIRETDRDRIYRMLFNPGRSL
jgi:c-di-GMP-binding flagellar brake protein YcgR